MRKQFLALQSGAHVLALSAGVGISIAAGPPAGTATLDGVAATGGSDNLESPYSKEQSARRAKAQELLLKGKIPAGTKVAQIGKGRYVQLAREDTDKIFVVLVEFGNERYPNPIFADKNAAGQPASNAQRFDGPLHNEIPQPDRKVDNSTLWQADYDQAHYVDMYFDRMAEYYETQSSGRYSVEGDVTEWVKVPFNQALYGRNYCGSIVCNTSRALVRDALAVWVKSQLDGGKTMAQVQSYLRSFDEWDRYDADGDGNFDEPDGFVDHFQIVHAGGDEAAGDPVYGTDAIWSHRSYANVQGGGPNGFAGVNVGSNGGALVPSPLVPNNPTGVWVGDYTVQPENGGLGVFAHEFGHDLGLPDLYDTSGNTGGAENSTAFWTLMSSGANIGDGGPDGIGDNPTDLGAWEKLQLGWLDYAVAEAGKPSSHRLGPAEGTTRNGKQGLVVVLPDKEQATPVIAPKTGTWAYWSGMGDMLDNTMTKSMTLPAGATISADVWYDTEAHFDYAFLEISTDNGANWTPIKTSLSLPASDDQGQFNTSGTGFAGSSGGAYVPMVTTVPLPTGAVQVRFRYRTDQNTGGKGVVFDNIAVTGSPVDGAETDTGWAFEGFSRMQNGVGVTLKFNAYVAENRGYRGYDTSLKTAYNFGFLDSRPDWVESYAYQDGLLISYWDTSFTNNNVGDHPGGGLILPVDAHPTFHHAQDGTLLRPRILSFDSTFSKQDTKAITVNINSKPTTIPAQKGVDTFDDTKDYWFATENGHATPHPGRYQPGWNSVKVPKTGTTISIKSGGPQSATMEVEVGTSK
jgi:immune inhibitor A